MLQQEEPGEYVLATGEAHSVREFAGMAFRYAEIEISWVGDNVDEKGRVAKLLDKDSSVKEGDIVVEIDPNYYRPTEVDFLVGDPSKAKRALGWEAKTTFDELVGIMVDYE